MLAYIIYRLYMWDLIRYAKGLKDLVVFRFRVWTAQTTKNGEILDRVLFYRIAFLKFFFQIIFPPSVFYDIYANRYWH